MSQQEQIPQELEHGMRLEDVQHFLRDHFDDEVTQVVALGAGAWSQAFAFRREDRDWVIRLGVHGQDFAKDQFAARFRSTALPIPQVTEVGQALGGAFAISERAFGDMLDTLDRPQMRAIIPAVLDMFDATRDADLSVTHGYGSWDALGNAPHETWAKYLLEIANDRPQNRTHGWREALTHSETGIEPFSAAYERLESLALTLPNTRQLIHSDLLNRNVLVADNHIAAVFDWGNATYGDALHDVAWFSYWSKYYPAMEGIDWEAEVKLRLEQQGLDVSDFDQRLLAYKIHIGLGAQAYNAFTGDWKELAINAQRTLALASR